MIIKKSIIFLLITIFLSSFVLGEAKIINTQINYTIQNSGCIIINGTNETTAKSNTSILILGEQNSRTEKSIGNNESFSGNFLVYMIREFACEEEAKLSNLTKSMIGKLDTSMSYLDLYLACNVSYGNYLRDYKIKEDDFAYKDNYSQCQNKLELKDKDIQVANERANASEDEKKRAEGQRLFWAIGGGLVAYALCYNMWKKKPSAPEHREFAERV